ncbi:hypothetical protein BN871_GR_00280 [Paenibacillus sp. P22]|nr:hypothetical protein BN871_GR_00280 [Paenibacillus sp. P22]
MTWRLPLCGSREEKEIRRKRTELLVRRMVDDAAVENERRGAAAVQIVAVHGLEPGEQDLHLAERRPGAAGFIVAVHDDEQELVVLVVGDDGSGRPQRAQLPLQRNRLGDAAFHQDRDERDAEFGVFPVQLFAAGILSADQLALLVQTDEEQILVGRLESADVFPFHDGRAQRVPAAGAVVGESAGIDAGDGIVALDRCERRLRPARLVSADRQLHRSLLLEPHFERVAVEVLGFDKIQLGGQLVRLDRLRRTSERNADAAVVDGERTAALGSRHACNGVHPLTGLAVQRSGFLDGAGRMHGAGLGLIESGPDGLHLSGSILGRCGNRGRRAGKPHLRLMQQQEQKRAEEWGGHEQHAPIDDAHVDAPHYFSTSRFFFSSSSCFWTSLSWVNSLLLLSVLSLALSRVKASSSLRL